MCLITIYLLFTSLFLWIDKEEFILKLFIFRHFLCFLFIVVAQIVAHNFHYTFVAFFEKLKVFVSSLSLLFHGLCNLAHLFLVVRKLGGEYIIERCFLCSYLSEIIRHCSSSSTINRCAHSSRRMCFPMRSQTRKKVPLRLLG
jgi:hypothetical protein